MEHDEGRFRRIEDQHDKLRDRVDKIEGKTNLATYLISAIMLLMGATFERVWNFLSGK